jgi:hypothetical protein
VHGAGRQRQAGGRSHGQRFPAVVGGEGPQGGGRALKRLQKEEEAWLG